MGSLRAPPTGDRMQSILVGALIAAIIIGLVYIYLDVYLHPGSYVRKSRRKKKGRRR